MFSIMASSLPAADAVSAQSLSALPSSGPARPSITLLLIAMLIGALIASVGFGGALYYFVRSGRLAIREDAAVKIPSPIETGTHLLVLDPLLVNLADDGGNAYLRLALTLQVANTATKKGSETRDDKSLDALTAVRDTALTVLGRQTAVNLLALDGKQRLKAELKNALLQHNPDLKVTQIYFTDFLVQR